MLVISKQHRACTRTTSKCVYSFLSTKLAGSFFLPFTFVFAPPLPLFHYTTRRPTSAFIRTPALRITKGPLVTEVDVVMSNVRHTVRLFGSKNGLLKHAISIQNVVNVQTMDNKELVMRIKTDVKNQKVFFADFNGFSMRKRTTLAKLPMQANFFPLPGQAFWEDATKRVSLHSRSSLGCASLEEGWFEVVLDRKHPCPLTCFRVLSAACRRCCCGRRCSWWIDLLCATCLFQATVVLFYQPPS